jgi:hypothetical protein
MLSLAYKCMIIVNLKKTIRIGSLILIAQQ